MTTFNDIMVAQSRSLLSTDDRQNLTEEIKNLLKQGISEEGLGEKILKLTNYQLKSLKFKAHNSVISLQDFHKVLQIMQVKPED